VRRQAGADALTTASQAVAGAQIVSADRVSLDRNAQNAQFSEN
jgi:hypothetical protein